MADLDVDWETCVEDGCVGARLPAGGSCWAHAAKAELDQALKQLSKHGQLDARGVTITNGLLARMLESAPHDVEGRPVLTDARFGRATFEVWAIFGRGAEFRKVTFEGDADFKGAAFERADFQGAAFEGAADFYEATFTFEGPNGADFAGTTFEGAARFAGAVFEGETWLTTATFKDEALFGSARFEGGVKLGRARFESIAVFRGASLNGPIGFENAAFQSVAEFDRAVFHGPTQFAEATFQRSPRFCETTFQGETTFTRVAFERGADFTEAIFNGETRFRGATFKSAAKFDRAIFNNKTGFLEATFNGVADFTGTIFKGKGVADFTGTTFEQTRLLGPMLIRKELVLDQTLFKQPVRVEASAAAVCCRGARFPAGVQLRVRRAQVVLDDADLAAPSILTGASPFPDQDERRWARALERLARLQATGIRAEWPRLLSARHADVAGLTVAGVDLRACRFAGAHHLDQLRVEESAFARLPRGWRWTTRQAIAEEHHWRATGPQAPARSGHGASDERLLGVSVRGAGRRRGWYGLAERPPAWLAVERPAPAQIAALYRALRKGREDSKDEPGAADFYYGEMEMRRHAKRMQIHEERQRGHRGTAIAAAVEHAVLWLYWLISGYGLRAWRALAALAVVIGLVGIGFSRVGFHHPHPSQVASWLYALQATVSLESRARQLSGQLTLPGELLRVGLRMTGPVLLGLAVLSIRGRVKR